MICADGRNSNVLNRIVAHTEMIDGNWMESGYRYED